MERPLALNPSDDKQAGDHRPPARDDPALARALMYLRACGAAEQQLASMGRQLQAAADPDASQETRTRLLMDRAMAMGRALIENFDLPQVLPHARQRRKVHRQELGKPVAPLRPGWWWAPWRRLRRTVRQLQRGHDD